MIRNVFTFGIEETPPANSRGYAIVYGTDRNDCRERMWARFGRNWAFQYDDEERAGVEKWGLHLVATIGSEDEER